MASSALVPLLRRYFPEDWEPVRVVIAACWVVDPVPPFPMATVLVTLAELPDMLPLTLFPDIPTILPSVTALLAMSSVATAPFAIFEVVIRLSCRSMVAIVPFEILLLVTASSANLSVFMAALLMIGEEAELLVPAKSPANLILPLVDASASGVLAST